MNFKKIANNDLEEELLPGLTFQQLMDAAIDGNGEFVLDPLQNDEEIKLSEKQWDSLYDAMFHVNEESTYTLKEFDKEWEKQNKFSQRYRCV